MTSLIKDGELDLRALPSRNNHAGRLKLAEEIGSVREGLEASGMQWRRAIEKALELDDNVNAHTPEELADMIKELRSQWRLLCHAQRDPHPDTLRTINLRSWLFNDKTKKWHVSTFVPEGLTFHSASIKSTPGNQPFPGDEDEVKVNGKILEIITTRGPIVLLLRFRRAEEEYSL